MRAGQSEAKPERRHIVARGERFVWFDQEEESVFELLGMMAVGGLVFLVIGIVIVPLVILFYIVGLGLRVILGVFGLIIGAIGGLIGLVFGGLGLLIAGLIALPIVLLVVGVVMLKVLLIGVPLLLLGLLVWGFLRLVRRPATA